MPSLQIRDLPEPLHRLLQHRAQAHRRSISQQALVDLETIAGDDGRERRRVVLDRIARRGPLTTALAADQTVEALIHADRERDGSRLRSRCLGCRATGPRGSHRCCHGGPDPRGGSSDGTRVDAQ